MNGWYNGSKTETFSFLSIQAQCNVSCTIYIHFFNTKKDDDLSALFKLLRN